MGEDVVVETAEHLVVALDAEVVLAAAPGEGMALPVFKRLLVDLVYDVAAEAVNAFVEVEAEYLLHLLHHRFVMPVEVGLLLAVEVKVVLSPSFLLQAGPVNMLVQLFGGFFPLAFPLR